MTGKPTPTKIHRFEINGVDPAIHCPFCGTKSYVPDSGEYKVCSHLLFIAHDMGVEYRAPAFDQCMNIVGIESDDVDQGPKGWDGFTDNVPLPNSVKFACYQGAPSFLGLYIGYTAAEH
jgi:hypothetical protein